mgnify:CR=1 FL=1
MTASNTPQPSKKTTKVHDPRKFAPKIHYNVGVTFSLEADDKSAVIIPAECNRILLQSTSDDPSTSMANARSSGPINLRLVSIDDKVWFSLNNTLPHYVVLPGAAEPLAAVMSTEAQRHSRKVALVGFVDDDEIGYLRSITVWMSFADAVVITVRRHLATKNPKTGPISTASVAIANTILYTTAAEDDHIELPGASTTTATTATAAATSSPPK